MKISGWIIQAAILITCGKLSAQEIRTKPMVLLWQVNPIQAQIKQSMCDLSEKGVTHVQSFSLFRKSDDYIKEYLSTADECKVRVVVNIGESILNIEEAAEKVRKWNNYQSIEYWQAADEIEIEEIASVNKRIRSIEKISMKKIFVSINKINEKQVSQIVDQVQAHHYDFHKYINPLLGHQQFAQMMAAKKTVRLPKTYSMTARAFNSPHKTRRINLVKGELIKEIKYYKDNNVRDIGIYGYNLNPNVGIADDVYILKDFEAAMALHQR